ncbi:MAG: PLP-dependent aminotransferase family protein [Succinivibrio sp.]
MLTYVLEKTRSEPLYAQLSRLIRDGILTGRIAPGERLPSKRPFAKNLGISVITVENAYARLSDEGYVVSQPKSGYFACDLKSVAAARRGDPLPARPDEESPRPLIADLTSSQNEISAFPFTVWSSIMRRELRCDRTALLTNPPPGGALCLRQAIASHLRAFHGLDVGAGQIVVGPGTEYLCALIVRLLGRKLRYAVEDPGYPLTGKVYRDQGVEVVRVPLDGEGMDAGALALSRADVAHVSPSHNFPTGVVMTPSRRYELLGWAAQREGRYIIEDDYDSEFRLSGRPISALKSVDALGRVIYMNTFTKTLASTVRISYMVLPPELSERFMRECGPSSCAVSTFEQYALARFIDEGSFETHLNRMRKLCLKKRAALMDLIRKSPLGARCAISGQDAGLHFLLKLRECGDDEAVASKALSLGVRIAPLGRFCARPDAGARRTFVVSYSSVPLETLPAVVDVLCKAMLP